jgi:hypothetical protein
MKDISIPITIDDMKQLPGVKLTRCSYFTVECDKPSPDWVLEFGRRSIPFLMTGLSGIIYRPLSRKSLFVSPKQIENLFNAIEKSNRLNVGTADVWIPNALIKPLLHKCKLKPRGITFRVRYRFFLSALEFRTGKLDLKRFMKLSRKTPNAVTFSFKEHIAFTTWREKQIDLARKQYPKSAKLVLQWKGSSESS